MDKEIIYYLFLAALLAFFSLGHTSIALLGFSLFLTLWLFLVVPRAQHFYNGVSFWKKVLIIGAVTLFLFVPSYFITPFFSSVIVFLGSYFMILLLFTVSKKIYTVVFQSTLYRYAILIPYLYFVVGLIIIVVAEKATEEAITRPSGKIMLLVGIILGISFMGTTLRLLSAQAPKKQLLQQKTLLFAFFIFLFAFLSRATGEGIIILKMISNSGIVLFLFGLPFFQLWKNRKKPQRSMQDIAHNVFHE